jgi:hypothetical protein
MSSLRQIDSGWASFWLAGTPLIGGLIVTLYNMVRSRGRKEAAIEAEKKALADTLARHETSLAELASGQVSLRKAMDHQTEAFTSRLDHQTEVLTGRLDRVVEAVLRNHIDKVA